MASFPFYSNGDFASALHAPVIPTTNISASSLLYFLKTISLGVAASSLAVAYSEILFVGTRRLYLKGKLQRYYPLPHDRGAMTAWLNSMSFTIPTALYAMYVQKGMERSWSFNPLAMIGYLTAYMFMHDSFFYWCHRTFHVHRVLYDYFHAMHHEYTYSMHVYIVGHAEIPENFLQVGLPWLFWTAVAGHNYWYWLLPLSFVLFTTLVGHSGYRSHWWLMAFHPFALPVAFVTGRWLLTTGDHQMHHSHRRLNFALFFRFWDTYCNTYKKCNVKAHDVAFWAKWASAVAAARLKNISVDDAGAVSIDGEKKFPVEQDEKKKEENEQKKEENLDLSDEEREQVEQARKWLGRHQVQFEEVEWGF